VPGGFSFQGRADMNPLASRIIAHYERHATAWDADRQSSGWNDKRWMTTFAGALAPAGQVLDLGCGSGRPIAQYLSQQGLRVTGVDASETMISLCRQRLPDQEWIVADMRTLSLGRRFEGILAWDSFFHLDHDHQRQMFAVFAEHAAPGAVLMFNSGPSHGEAIGNYRGDPLYHASLAPDEYRELIGRFGFRVIEHVGNDAQAGGRTAWICKAQADPIVFSA
jgi:SAM-dependent methyltransferase